MNPFPLPRTMNHLIPTIICVIGAKRERFTAIMSVFRAMKSIAGGAMMSAASIKSVRITDVLRLTTVFREHLNATTVSSWYATMATGARKRHAVLE